MFSHRQVAKTYLALVHGHLAKDDTTVTLPIARDLVRRTRMTTRRPDGRTAVSHFHVLERITLPTAPSPSSKSASKPAAPTRSASTSNPSVTPSSATLSTAPPTSSPTSPPSLKLDRNFLHAAHLSFTHPQTGKPMELDAPLPLELETFLKALPPDSHAFR